MTVSADPRPIRATYRLQFHAGFRLDDARRLVPYLRDLGISHLHSSPLLAARTGSMHGYDVTDPGALNPALGTEQDLAALVAELHANGMGLVLDIVPNHMAASTENPFWQDVLTYGPVSPYAAWFDIEWRSGSAGQPKRVVLPVLGDMLSRVIARDELTLEVDGGVVRVGYFEHRWPVDPLTLAPLLRVAADACERAAPACSAAELFRAEGLTLRRTAADAAHRVADACIADSHAQAALETATAMFVAGDSGRRRLRRLLDAQHYRLVYWRRAARELNYRRFFDVNELVSLRMEDPAVFERTHARVLEWRSFGWIDGFRIDHPDGLLDPLGYLRRLTDAAFEWRADARYPIYVEKILSGEEQLGTAWPAAGTTGYDFLNVAERVFIDSAGFEAMEADYRRLLRRPVEFAAVAHAGKRRALQGGLSAGVRHLAVRLIRLSDGARGSVSVRAAKQAIVEVITALPVYRTYVDRHSMVPVGEDREVLAWAVETARAAGRAAGPALDLLADVLLGELPPNSEVAQVRFRFIQRFQQLSGPAMAKGVEDTAFYAYVPLLSANEVGGGPEWIAGDAVAAFHGASAMRAAHWPRAMLAVTTHDTKRSADVRARLDVLSEIPGEWEERVYRWRKWNRAHKRRDSGGARPDVNTIYLLYQTLVGMWPAGRVDEGCRDSLRMRVQDYMRKAVREAKLQTSWLDADAEFEAALADYIDRILDPALAPEFLADLGVFIQRIAAATSINTLSRTLLHLTAPGVPDIYQGDEMEFLALVDPDNRRPVDFDRRRGALGDLGQRFADARDRDGLISELVRSADDGRLKLFVHMRALAVRREYPALFIEGGYEPVAVDGAESGRVMGYVRRHGAHSALVMIQRFSIAGQAERQAGHWRDTTFHLPAGLANVEWQSALTGTRTVLGDQVSAADAFAQLPLELLIATAR